MVQGRLYAQDVRQFTGRGIPLVKELAEKYHTTADAINEMVSAGKIGFADVEEVLNKMTNSGGQFYNLMENNRPLSRDRLQTYKTLGTLFLTTGVNPTRAYSPGLLPVPHTLWNTWIRWCAY